MTSGIAPAAAKGVARAREAEAADLVFLNPDGDAIAAISNDRSTSTPAVPCAQIAVIWRQYVERVKRPEL
jgi:hypothetical protein